MRRKFAMIVAFVVAMTGAIATKAAASITFVSLDCETVIHDCPGGFTNCGYVKGDCIHIIKKI